MIRVLLVEDQAMVLGALSALLNLEDDIQVEATASDGTEALALCREEDFDVVISDVEMPNMNGLDLAQALNSIAHPAKVIILTTFSRAGYVKQAMEASVGAYLLKDSPPEELARTLREVIAGRVVVSPELVQVAWQSGDNPLSKSEKEVLRLALEGKSTESIASILYLSHGTVRNYAHSACQKLHCKNRVEAAQMGHNLGWL